MSYDPSNKVSETLVAVHQSLSDVLTRCLVKGYHGEVTVVISVHDGHPGHMDVGAAKKFRFGSGCQLRES